MASQWYTAIYPGGVVPPREPTYHSYFTTVLAGLKAFKSRTDDPKAIFRVLAPATATTDELRQLVELGAHLV